MYKYIKNNVNNDIISQSFISTNNNSWDLIIFEINGVECCPICKTPLENYECANNCLITGRPVLSDNQIAELEKTAIKKCTI